jgi:hypothetical protein
VFHSSKRLLRPDFFRIRLPAQLIAPTGDRISRYGASIAAECQATLFEVTHTVWLAFGVAIQRCLQLLSDPEAANDEFVDFEPADAGATDCQPTNSESADGQRSNRDGCKRERPSRLCSDADRLEVSARSRELSSVTEEAWTMFARVHEIGLGC